MQASKGILHQDQNGISSLLKNLEIGALLVFFALGFWGGRDERTLTYAASSLGMRIRL